MRDRVYTCILQLVINFRLVSFSLDLNASMDGMLVHDSDVEESVVIRRQLIRLTRRLMHLEEENNRRSQREMVVYPVGYWICTLSNC